MSTPWLGLLQLLLTLAVLGPYVDLSARVAAGVAWCALIVVFPRRRSVLVPAAVLGLVSVGRLGRVDDGAEAQSEPAIARFEVVARADEGRVVAWVDRPHVPPQRWLLGGLEPGLQPGSRGWAEVVATPAISRRNPDDTDRRRRVLSHGVRIAGYARRGTSRVLREAPPPRSLRLRGWAATVWRAKFADNAALWEALLLGDRTGLGTDLRRRFARLGLAHLLALSGLHVGVVCGVLLWPLRRWGRRAVLWTLPLLVAWALVAGMSSSLYRSVAMLGWWALGRRWGRPTAPIDGLAVVAVLEITVRPVVVLGVGWWLSYCATAAILRGGRWWARWPRLAAAVAVSVAAQAATLPWTLGTFGALALGSPILLLAVGPVFAAALVAGVLVASVSLVFTPPGASLILAFAGHSLGLILALASRWMPAPVGHPGIHGASWAAALVALGLVLPPWRGRGRLRFTIAVAMVASVHVPIAWRAPVSWTTLDVGQGDSAVYRAGRRALVVDAGPASPRFDAGRSIVLPYLARRNLARVDLLITHGHLDHFGGARALLESGRVQRVLVAACDSAQDWSRDLRLAAWESASEWRFVSRGDTLRCGPWPVAVLWPDLTSSHADKNSRSIVVSVGAPGARLLATGDLERGAETVLKTAWGQALGDVSFLKVAHHGGNTGTDTEWVSALGTELVAVISCGRGNRYGHPHPAVLERLRRAGAAILRTDESGAVRVFWDRCGRPHWSSVR